MKLYLVRHGEAVPPEVDPACPLSERGRTEVERLAGFMRQARIGVARVIHSGRLRARQTAEILAAQFAPDVTLETSDMLDPGAPPQRFALQVAGLDFDTLVVGHLPFMAKLVALLAIGREDQTIVNYPPGTVVCLEQSADGAWSIAWMMRPSLLDA